MTSVAKYRSSLPLQTRPQRHPLLASTFHRSKGLAVALDEGGEQTFQLGQSLTQKLRRDIKGPPLTKAEHL